MEVYQVRIVGVRPLLMNSPSAFIGDKPTLRRGEHLDPKTEAELRLYKDEEGNIVIPAYMVKACIREAGRNYRVRGRCSTFASMIRAGIIVQPEMIPLEHNGWVVDVRPVVVQKQRILRYRPRFNKWALNFEVVNLDPTVIHADILRKILDDAGKFCGLGDYRPEYGLFRVERFVVVK